MSRNCRSEMVQFYFGVDTERSPNRFAPTVFALLAIGFQAHGETPSTQTISVEPGKNTDVYFEINLTGKAYLAIYTIESTNCFS